MDAAAAYRPALVAADARPRVLVTGFGRFGAIRRNASGCMLALLLDDLRYPVTEPPRGREIDPPGPQLAVARGSVALDGVGEALLCAMVLPVFWDLAAALIAAELNAFRPDLVIMNGVAGPRQDLWIELGAINRVRDSVDGSTRLRPAEPGGPVIAGAAWGRPNLASWSAVRQAAQRAILAHSERIGDTLGGVTCKAFPRASNDYLCNNTTYAVGHLMDHPGVPTRLMEQSSPRDDDVAMEVIVERDLSQVPRFFLHWPAALSEAQLAGAADVLRAIIAAQLSATARGEPPSRAHDGIADDTNLLGCDA